MVNIDDYFLPRISVKTDIIPYDFFVRIGKIAEEYGGIEARKIDLSDSTLDGHESLPSLTLSFKNDKSIGLKNLWGSFHVRPGIKERVWVDLTSDSWIESGPKYEEYVGLITHYFKPLLSIYNKKYNTRHRFKIPSKESLEPKLSECAARLLKNFVDNANKSFLSRDSWKDFYEFIIYCHRRNEWIHSDSLKYLLKKAEFNDFYCENLCGFFERGWDLLEQLPESKLKAFRKKIRELDKREQIKYSYSVNTEKRADGSPSVPE